MADICIAESNSSSVRIQSINIETTVPHSTLRKRFSGQEDSTLKHVIQELNVRNWEEAAKYLPGRTARQCRDRYNNYLFKEISNKPWSEEEDLIILTNYPLFGTHWVKISKFLVGRSGNNVKNRWYKYLSKHYNELMVKYDFIQKSNQKAVDAIKAKKIEEEKVKIDDCWDIFGNPIEWEFFQNNNDALESLNCFF
ncbi:Myb-like DNA-binding domain containing protein [Tritrichomonas foetus]|uniref:Myb-like DNA-binding domain containing protein n=1 Tax=Tritrichomonas foetus TaxID=1144522 RepID=A0A1J4J7D7_9EUKA|nr:Myb-like DNA-binding domain containing protein [Tritrichomonas foetus]|eukprot:OHS95138.1 Myb-like DNA-binding domain containing protein [Tritrichomonas foetus]